MLGDAAYDSAELREQLDERGTKPVIPNRCNRKQPFTFNKRLYKLRWRIEAAFNRLKDFRRIGFAELVIGPATSGGTPLAQPGLHDYNALCARARAAAVRVATRSSSAIISSTSARSKPWVMKTILLRRSASGQRSSQDRLCRRCCAPWITAGRSGSSATLHDALHAQEVRPEILLKRVEQKPQRFARDRRRRA